MELSKTILGIAVAISMACGTTYTLAATAHQDEHKPAHSQSEKRHSEREGWRAERKTSHSEHGAKWGYKGSIGPAHWGKLSDQYILCKTGKTQSPINFHHVFSAGRTELDLDYHVAELVIENNGHTIKVSYPAGSYLQVAGQNYKLLQFHYHAPSEHTERGRFHDMEIHFVHQAADGTLAVIGVFVDEGPENLALREIWNHLPRAANQKKTVGKEIINARDLIPEGAAFYRYMGSLTTPPCSEGVNWFVMKRPIYASKEQLDKFRAIMQGNNRPTQPVNQRLIMDLQ
jgi:carbonic anhydrase